MNSRNVPSIAFFAQPTAAMAAHGEAKMWSVIHLLKEWHHGQHLVAKLSTPKVQVVDVGGGLSLFLLLGDAFHSKAQINVCYFGDTIEGRAIGHWDDVLQADHLHPLFSAPLDHLKPDLFRTLSAANNLVRTQILRELGHNAIATTAENHRRWGSSEARAKFRELFDHALLDPQIVERGDEELVVVSKRYFEEAVKPSSGHALARKYRNSPLSLEGMEDLPPLPMGRLETLPEL